MKFLLAFIAICLIMACVAGQHQRYFLGQVRSARVPRQYSSFQANIRDPRQNRGPVLFPPPPADQMDESSGVIVGASGYGFVPPQQSQVYYLTTLNAPASTYTAFDYFSNPFVHRFNIF